MQKPSIGCIVVVRDLRGVENPAIVHTFKDFDFTIEATVLRLANQPHPVFACRFFETKTDAHAWLDANGRKDVVALLARTRLKKALL